MAQPDKVLFSDVDVTISVGDRVAVVGVNGSGKTTLLRIMTGALQPDSGVVRFGRGSRIVSLEQDPKLPEGIVRDVLGDGWEVQAAATSLGVLPLFDRRTDELSGGQAKRVALAKVLADDQQGAFDMVVLDEPTNHLDLEAIEWLEARLVAMKAALVLVTHDRHALDRLTSAVGPSRVVELDNGRSHIHQAAAGTSAYATYLDARADRIDREASEESTRKILARKELAWLRRGAPARSTKPKARLRSAHEIIAGGPAAAGVRGNDLELGAGTTRLGNQVIELTGVTQRFGDHTVFSDVDLLIEPGARLAVVGPNGSGKTTLLDIIAGRKDPVAGVVDRGQTVVVGYADQHSSKLDPDAIVRKVVAGPYREPDHEDKALLEKFWFDSTAQFAPTRMLSGGERRRLQLVMVLATKPNLLILDEPTNDLDLDTLRSLEAFLDDWPGALVTSSHDRAFLDRVADHVLAIDEFGAMQRVPGGVSGWLADRAALTGKKSGKQTGKKSGKQTGKQSDGTKPSGSAKPKAAGSSSGGGKPKSARTGPSASTIGRQLREAEQAMVKTQKRVDTLADKLSGLVAVDELLAVGNQLSAAQIELDELEATWLELADESEG
ncbi:MAG: ATP-binding cassette subfamily F protein uup [Ilumatobacter sp.]|jgi:ATP-binding cassette subfamily F protein uup